MAVGDFAKFNGSGQGLPPLNSYGKLSAGTKTVDAGNIVSLVGENIIPQEAGYYLILCTGRFDSTNNNRTNIQWKLFKNDFEVSGSAGSGYARNVNNSYAWMKSGSVLFFNGTTDFFSVQHKKDTGSAVQTGIYGFTDFKVVQLGLNLPYASYDQPNQNAYANSIPNTITGWNTLEETDTNIIENIDGTAIRLKEANRPYLIIYSLENNNVATVRTTRVSDITLGGNRVSHSAGYAYQRDTNNAFATPFGIALVRPTEVNQDINIRCWGYDNDGFTQWGTFNNGAWELSSIAGNAGFKIIALPSTTDFSIYENLIGNQQISGTSSNNLMLDLTTVFQGNNFQKITGTTIIDALADTSVFSWGATMVERIATSGFRNTSAIAWRINSVNQSQTEYGSYLRGDQGNLDTYNMVLFSDYINAVSVNDQLQIQKFNPLTNDGNNDFTSWGGSFYIDLSTLVPETGEALKVWDGSAWVICTHKMWDGTAWKPVKYWNGTEWIV